MKPTLRLVQPGDPVEEQADANKPDIVALLLEEADAVAAGDATAIAEAPHMLRGAAALIAMMRTRRTS